MNDHELMEAVLDRAKKMERQKQMKTIKVATAITVCCSLFVVVGLSVAMSIWIANTNLFVNESDSVVGTLLANSHAMGYAMVGMISFAIGVGITIFCYQLHKKTLDKLDT